MEINQAISEFFRFCIVERNLSKETVESYKIDLDSFLKSYENIIDTNQLSKDDIDTFVFDLSINGYSSATIRRRISCLQTFYTFLESEDIKKNILVKIDMPKLENKLPSFLNDDEVNLLINFYNGDTKNSIRNKAIINILYSCGLRVSELINLKIDNINNSDYLIKVSGKGNKERLIPIRKEAYNDLINYIDNVRSKIIIVDKKYLFLTNGGKKISRQLVNQILDKAAKECNIDKPVHPHTLRHSFATLLINNGASLRIVQELLGHSNLETTQIYTHMSNSKAIEAYNLFWDKK